VFAAAVARIYCPGIKFDSIPVFDGAQGIGKSSLFRELAGAEYYSETLSLTDMNDKAGAEKLQGYWIVEVAELAGMKKAEAETIKLYISKQTDRFRPAYGRRLQEFPRQCIFIGTTNETQFLRDATGNRRYWVVDTPNEPAHDMWDELTDEVVRQVWAEAVEIYKKGEKLYLPRDIEKTAREVQESYEEENPRVGIIADYLDRLLPEDWDGRDTYNRRAWLENDDGQGTVKRTTVCALEIWAEALGGNPDKLDRYAIKEIGDIMARMPGWKRTKNKMLTIKPYGRQRYYERNEKQ
jgi:predicted P-loop ATPase